MEASTPSTFTSKKCPHGLNCEIIHWTGCRFRYMQKELGYLFGDLKQLGVVPPEDSSFTRRVDSLMGTCNDSSNKLCSGGTHG